MHGGTVAGVERGAGRGSTFEIALALADGRRRTARRPADEHGRRASRSLRAIVCDDTTDLRELVADLLRLRGHEVTVVADGPAAVERDLPEKPDVALIDIGLPDMDGYEVARRGARRRSPSQRPRLDRDDGVRAGRAIARAAFEAGFDAHIVKPATADTILRALYGNSGEP